MSAPTSPATLMRTWPSLVRLTPLAVVLAGFGLGVLLGREAAADPAASPPSAAAAAAAAAAVAQGLAAPMRLAAGLDLDGDGRLDVVRPVDSPVRGLDAYGSGAFGSSRDGGRRPHRGVDLVAAPGAAVRAPISGMVTRVGDAYRGGSGLSYVEIANPDTRYVARVLYVGPAVAPGAAVMAGDLIGEAQDLGARYPAGMTNHVHVELTGRNGGPLDPLIVLPGAHQQGPLA